MRWWFAVTAVLLGCGSSNAPAPERRAHARIVPPMEASEPPASPATSRHEDEDLVEDAREPAYALDRMSRKVPITGKAFCPPIDLVSYHGDTVRFQKPLRINAAFLEHVREFEAIVRDAAVEVYGRPPSRIEHFGSFYCRRISTWPYLVSEHGLGNAVDIGGFHFDRLRGDEWADAPARWRKKFSTSISRDWSASGADAEHARFLRLVARRAIEREGLFRVVLGPAHPNHSDHLHLDMARWRVVNVF